MPDGADSSALTELLTSGTPTGPIEHKQGVCRIRKAEKVVSVSASSALTVSVTSGTPTGPAEGLQERQGRQED
jgi:hypothetical protein